MSAATTEETDPLALGRAALDSADWDVARARFEQAVAADPTGAGWEGLSWAAWWQGDHDAVFAARERAYRAYRQAGEPCGAARMAMWLGSDHFDFRGDDAVAAAWLRRAQALVDGLEPCPEQGYNLLLAADIALFAHADPATALAGARDAIELARRIPDTGVEVVGTAIMASALVAQGDVEEGLRRLDECASLAVAEHFDFIVAPGWALCHTVQLCTYVGDFGRAGQWCRALHTWSEKWQGRHFFGICRTAYGDVLATSGDWRTAEEELSSALEDMSATRPFMAALTAVRLGRLRASQGDVAAARELYEAALPLPHAVLALGELDMEAGDPQAGVDAADRVLRNLGELSVLERFPALELRGRAAARAGDAAAARATAEELARDAERLGTPYMRGRSRLVTADVLRAAGDHDGVRRAAEDAVDLFGRCAAPYDAARARLVLAEGLRALGRDERAAAEERAAREGLARLRAVRPDAAAATEELSPRETEILRLVAQGLGDAEIAARLFLSPHTVHRHVANVRAKLRTPSRAAAVAYATRHGLL
jgi:ATP/maltotriose-dependent transcriptional regulator MalT